MHPHSTRSTQPLVRALVELRELKVAFLAPLSIEASFVGAFELIEDTLNASHIGGFNVAFGRGFTQIADNALLNAQNDELREEICELIFTFALTMVTTRDVEIRSTSRSTCEQKISELATPHVFKIAS